MIYSLSTLLRMGLSMSSRPFIIWNPFIISSVFNPPYIIMGVVCKKTLSGPLMDVHSCDGTCGKCYSLGFCIIQSSIANVSYH